MEGTNSYEGAAIPLSKMKWDPINVTGVNVKRKEQKISLMLLLPEAENTTSY